MKVSRLRLLVSPSRAVTQALGVTVMAFILSILIVEPVSFSAMSLFSTPEKSDFSITDLYSQIADRRPVRTLDPDILIVDIGDAGRDRIAEIIQTVALCSPKAIGLDIMFAEPHADDSALLEAIATTPGIVVPIGLSNTGDGNFHITEKPFFHDRGLDVRYAAANLPGKFDGATIREFQTYFKTAGTGHIPSFATEVAKAADPGALAELRARGNDIETIDYPSREFTVIEADRLMERGEELTGKIALIGTVNDAHDMHSTPVDSRKSGIEIHAAAISTVLGNRYYDTPGALPDWLYASALCFAVALARFQTRPEMRGLLTRLMQVVIVWGAVQIGYTLYVEHRIVFNFTYTLLMVTFGLFAADIWIGLTYLLTKTRGKVKNTYGKLKLLWHD